MSFSIRRDNRRSPRTVNGEPEEHSARLEATLNLINPLVIERHPRRAALALPVARLRGFPEVRCVHILDELDRVQSPAALHRHTPDAESSRQNRALGRRVLVHVTAEEEHDWAEEEDNGGKGVREIEADILSRTAAELGFVLLPIKAGIAHLLGIDHRDLTDQSTNVDEQIEVHVDSRRGHDGVDNDTLAGLGVADEELVTLILFCDKRGDVRLETASTETHNNNSDDEAC